MNLAIPLIILAAFNNKHQIIYHLTNWSILIYYKNCRN